MGLGFVLVIRSGRRGLAASLSRELAEAAAGGEIVTA